VYASRVREDNEIDEFLGLLTRLHWTQAGFARRAQIAPYTVNRWAKGESPLPGWVLRYLRLAADVKTFQQQVTFTYEQQQALTALRKRHDLEQVDERFRFEEKAAADVPDRIPFAMPKITYIRRED